MTPSDRKALFSSGNDEWEIPHELFAALHREFRFEKDAFASILNAKLPSCFTKQQDALQQDWGYLTYFANPPYSKIAVFLRKCFDASQAWAFVVALVPSRTDTRWWHSIAMKGEIRLLAGRLRFVGAKASAPFPSAILVMRPPSFRLLGFCHKSPVTSPLNLHSL